MSKRHLFSSKLFTLMDNDWQKGADNPKREWKIEKEKSILVLESVFSAYLPSQLCRAWANICVHVQSLSTQKPAWIRKVLWRRQFTNKVRTDCHSALYQEQQFLFFYILFSPQNINRLAQQVSKLKRPAWKTMRAKNVINASLFT